MLCPKQKYGISFRAYSVVDHIVKSVLPLAVPRLRDVQAQQVVDGVCKSAVQNKVVGAFEAYVICNYVGFVLPHYAFGMRHFVRHGMRQVAGGIPSVYVRLAEGHEGYARQGKRAHEKA